jgi:hypothetical protein
MTRLLMIVFMLTAVPASAQRIEFSPVLFGYATSSEIQPTADPVTTLAIDGAATLGAQFGYLLTSHVEIEGVWTRRETGLTVGTPAGTTTLFFITANELSGNVVYRFQRRSNPIQPFLFAGLGVMRMTAPDLEPESNLAWNVGGGVTWFMFKHVGIRVDGRYDLVDLSTANSTSCSPLQFCQDALESVIFTAGLALRF